MAKQQILPENNGEEILLQTILEEQKNSEQEQKVIELKTPVIIIAKSEISLELYELTVKQWEKHLPDNPIMIVGGNFGELPVIEAKLSSDEDIKLANILAAIVADERISETFILAPVGTFPVKQVIEKELSGLYCISTGPQKQELTCMKNITELYVTKQLQKEGFRNVYNYETGLPVMLEKTKVAELFEKFNPQKYPTKVISLYLNYFNKETKPVPVHFGCGEFATRVIRSNPNMDIVKKGLKESSFITLNNDGYMAVSKLF